MNTLFQDNDDQLTLDDNKNYLEDLVGENKKFKDVQSLAKGKAEADLYIQTLTRKLDEMRNDYTRLDEEYKSGASLRELIDQLKTQSTNSENNLNANGNENNQPIYDPNEIKNLARSAVQEYEQSKRQQDNFKLVESKLKEEFGENFKQTLRQRTESLGLTQTFVDDLALNHPEVLFRTLGLGQRSSEQFQSPPRSDRRSDNFSPSVQKRTWAYYQKMKRDNPTLYNDPKTTVQLHKDAQEQGEDFFDTD